jgi:hypothetical protein
MEMDRVDLSGYFQWADPNGHRTIERVRADKKIEKSNKLVWIKKWGKATPAV